MIRRRNKICCRALSGAVTKLAIRDYVLLFDRIEMMGDIHRKVRVKLTDPQARELS